MPFVVALLAVPLARIVIAIVLWGLVRTANSWMHPLVDSMTKQRSFLYKLLRASGALVVLRGVDWVVHRATHRMSHSAALNTAPVGKYLDGVAARMRAVNGAQVAHADAVADSMTQLRFKTVPYLIRVRVRPVAVAAAAAGAYAGRIDHRERAHAKKLARGIDRLEDKALALALGFLGIDYLVKKRHKAKHHASHRGADHVRTKDVPQIKTRVRSHGRRITKVEKAITTGAIGALVASFALSRFPSWRCSNARNLRRLLRCSHWRFLESLLFIAVDVLTLRDLCALVGLIERGAIAFQPTVHNLLVAGENFICGDSAHMPTAIVASDRDDSPGFASGVISADLAY